MSMKIPPSPISFGSSRPGEASRNCGRKAKKNTVNFGFRTFKRIPRHTTGPMGSIEAFPSSSGRAPASRIIEKPMNTR
jgi:hypothetical protein